MRKLKIDVIASEGSPLNVTEQSIYGIDGRVGVGGAELGILTLCRLWHNAGHDVTLYNDGAQGNSVFNHKPQRNFNPEDDRDVAICFRSPDERLRQAKGRRIWYSNDQFTSGNYAAYADAAEKIVCISPFHVEYFKQFYNIFNAEVIDIPIRTWEYAPVEKKRHSCIFTSVPDRGLLFLAPIWKHIVEQVPDATLTITGDWSLWNNGNYTHELEQYRRAFAGMTNVTYLSAVKREELVKIQAEAEFHLYPCVYDELFCISVAESQVAGAIPITSRIGAVDTTNRFGYKIDGHPKDSTFKTNFINKTVELMQNEIPDISVKAKKEFGEEEVLSKWYKIFDLEDK